MKHLTAVIPLMATPIRLLGVWLVLATVALALPSACSLLQEPDGTLVYVRIDTILMEGDPASQGLLTHKFEDAWVFVDDQSIAAFSLPAVFPVLVQEDSRIVIVPGIRKNGFSNSRIAYPLTEIWDATPIFREGDTILLKPKTRFAGDVDFHRVINFETSTPFDAVSGTVPMQVTDEDSLVLEGTRSAYIALEEATDIIELRSEIIPGAAFPLSADTIPEDDSPVFLEMDYRCNQVFDIWLRTSPPLGSTSQPINEYILTLAPQDNWNKIYIGLTEELGSLGTGARYQIVFRGIKDPSIDRGDIYLDNLKLVSR